MTDMDNVRALLRQFAQSDYRVLHAVADGFDIFFSRDPAMRDPYFIYGEDEAARAAEIVGLRAPHLGTLVEVASPGAVIVAGAVYGRLVVLDRVTDLVAAVGGRVVSTPRAPGDLVEYDDVLIELET